MTHLLNLDYNTPKDSGQQVLFSISRQHTNEFSAELWLKKTGKKFQFSKNTANIGIGSCSSLANSNAELTVNYFGNGQPASLLLGLKGGSVELKQRIITKAASGKQRVHYSIFFKPE